MILRLLTCLTYLCGFATASALATEPADLLQRNRELVAKDYEKKPGQLSTVRIFLRSALKSGSPLGGTTKADEIEVVTRLKSGDELVIDRLPGSDPAMLPTIIDSEGVVVGFFRNWETKEDIWIAARSAFAIYLAGPQSVFSRAGELECKKIPSNGKAAVSIANARWSGDVRELEFNARATCGRVNYFGGPELKKLFVLSITGIGSESSYTEEEGRILVQFTERGDVASASLLKGGAEAARMIRKCEADGKVGAGFKVCGPDADGDRTAYWSYQGALVETEFACTEGVESASGLDFLALSCRGENETQKPTGRWVMMEIASQNAPRDFSFKFTCKSCGILTARRLSFDGKHREITFNLETDAKIVDFEGGQFEVPPLTSRVAEGKSVMSTPIFTVRLNEQWQIIEVSATPSGAGLVSTESLLPATTKNP